MARRTRGKKPQRASGKETFGGFIAPATLLEQVRSAMPWLLPPGAPPAGPSLRHDPAALADADDGFLRVLRAAGELSAMDEPDDAGWCAYFALCLAAHFATTASFVPTDVDTKIRDHLWFRPSPEALPTLFRLALATGRWDTRPVSARVLDHGELGLHSGHDGERLSVWTSGLLRCTVSGRPDLAEALRDTIHAELQRESAALLELAQAPPRDASLILLGDVITHNVGDVDQGLSAKSAVGAAPEARAAFARLGHERPERYGGAFLLANRLSRVVAADGHRHYPLREVRELRGDRRLLRPIAPFLTGWGETLATFPEWSGRQRAAVAQGLIVGCERVPGQMGYYRALHGMDRALRGGLRALGSEMAANVWRRAERDRELWRQVDESETEFLARLNRRAVAAIQEAPRPH